MSRHELVHSMDLHVRIVQCCVADWCVVSHVCLVAKTAAKLAKSDVPTSDIHDERPILEVLTAGILARAIWARDWCCFPTY